MCDARCGAGVAKKSEAMGKLRARAASPLDQQPPTTPSIAAITRTASSTPSSSAGFCVSPLSLGFFAQQQSARAPAVSFVRHAAPRKNGGLFLLAMHTTATQY